MISFLDKHLTHWCKNQSMRLTPQFTSNYPYLSFNRKKRCIWIPICVFLVVYLIYGIFEDLYQLALILTKFKPSFWINISAILFGLLFAWLCLYSAMYVQDRYVKIKSISRHNWWIDIGIGILAAWLLPSITSIVLDIILKVRPNIATNQKLINRMMGMHGTSLIVIILMSVIIGPVVEEIMFRFLLIGPSNFNKQVYAKDYRFIMIAFSLLFFAYEHIHIELSVVNWSNQTSILMLLIDTAKYLVMGAVFTTMYIHTNDIRTSITTHIGYNLLGTIVQGIMMFA